MAPSMPDIFQCCRSCLRHLSIQKRAFTTTSARRKHGAVPSFQSTQSPDLDILLSKFRANIFVPAHLIQLQKDLVYKRSNWHLLTNPDEPATVRMGDEVHQLQPLDRTIDEPPTLKSIHRVLELMQKSGDWRNLPGFLEGLKSAKRKVNSNTLQKAVRKVIEAGQMGIVLDCVRRVKVTGLSLSDLGLAREVIFGATAGAIQGEWSEEAVNKATQYSENIWDELWDKKHASAEEISPRTQPEVIGILVQMHAAKVLLFGAGEEEVQLVQKYVALMLKHWEHAELPEAKSLTEHGKWSRANEILVLWSPVWHAMKMVKKIVGGETPLGETLEEKLELVIEPLLKESRLLVENKALPRPGKSRGMDLLEEVLKLHNRQN